jgi:hypothetical protein
MRLDLNNLILMRCLCIHLRMKIVYKIEDCVFQKPYPLYKINRKINNNSIQHQIKLTFQILPFLQEDLVSNLLT